jgi:flagellar basal-body rod protein FlgC
MYKIFEIAGSALTAQSLRLNLVSSNLANADTVSSSAETAYRARNPVFAAMLEGAGQDARAVGVNVLGVVESPAPTAREYNPSHPMADKDGYIHMTNVNTVEEMTNMISASRAYQNNVEVMNTSKQLLLSTLRLGQ